MEQSLFQYLNLESFSQSVICLLRPQHHIHSTTTAAVSVDDIELLLTSDLIISIFP